MQINLANYIESKAFGYDQRLDDFRDEYKAAFDTETYRKVHPEVDKQWVGFVFGFNEWADGVTGVKYYGHLVCATSTDGFKNKGDVRRTILEKGIKVGKMEVVGKAFNGGNRRKGYDVLVVLKVPDMAEWVKEHADWHRLKYVSWTWNDTFFTPETK